MRERDLAMQSALAAQRSLEAAIERSPEIAARWPLLRQAVRLVGHPQIRARGTIGGSVANADPKAELPVALSVSNLTRKGEYEDISFTVHAGEILELARVAGQRFALAVVVLRADLATVRHVHAHDVDAATVRRHEPSVAISAERDE